MKQVRYDNKWRDAEYVHGTPDEAGRFYAIFWWKKMQRALPFSPDDIRDDAKVEYTNSGNAFYKYENGIARIWDKREADWVRCSPYRYPTERPATTEELIAAGILPAPEQSSEPPLTRDEVRKMIAEAFGSPIPDNSER